MELAKRDDGKGLAEGRLPVKFNWDGRQWLGRRKSRGENLQIVPEHG